MSITLLSAKVSWYHPRFRFRFKRHELTSHWFNVVNPHVIPFLQTSLTTTKGKKFASFCMSLARGELQHRCTQVGKDGS
jgi:hypothetical protein